MTVKDIRSFALHVSSEHPFVQPVKMTSTRASVLVVATRIDGLSPCVVIADCEGLGRAATGLPAIASIHEVIGWCRQNLPSDWVAGDGPLWICINGVGNGCFVVSDKPGRVLWTRLKWPGQTEGALTCFVKALPAFADSVIRVLDDNICV